MPWIAPVIAGVAGVAGGAIGAGSAASDRQAALNAWQQSVADLEKIGIPTAEAQQISMQRYKSAGQWTPEMEQTVKQGDSGLNLINTDPTYKQAQLKALGQLQDIGSNGGMMLSDRAALEKQMGNISADERGKREAILQDAQQRGGYGSGTSLVAQLMNQQGSAERTHQAGLETAANAQGRALQAIQSAGQMGGQMQATDFNQQAEKAKAQDAINAWNASNSQAVRSRNAGVGNQASQYNLANAQNLSNSNTDIANKEQIGNKGLQQQQFNNQLAVGQAKANARAQQATQLQNNANQTASQWAGIGSSIGQGVTAYAQGENQNDQRQKDRDAGISTK